MKQKPKLTELAVCEIEATANTQVRRALDQKVIADYGEAMLAGALFPALTAFSPKNSERYILADGFHRLAAANEVGYDSYPCEVFVGDSHDALEFALGANNEHGLRRSVKDKQNAVEIALKDPVFSKESNRKIGRICNVSHHFVKKIRNEHGLSDTEGKKPKKDAKTTKSEKPAKDTGGNVPSVDNGNRRDLVAAMNTIMTMPFDGAEAVERLSLADLKDDLEYCRDWFAEAMEKCNGDK